MNPSTENLTAYYLAMIAHRLIRLRGGDEGPAIEVRRSALRHLSAAEQTIAVDRAQDDGEFRVRIRED